MVPAQQNTVRDVGAAVFSMPGHDVVRLAPGGRSLAAGEPASAVARGQADALSGGEQALVAPDVDHLAAGVEVDGHRAVGADAAFDRGDRDRCALPFEVSGSAAAGQVGVGDEHPHGRRASAEDGAVVGRRSEANQFDERVECDLVGRARVANEPFGAFGRSEVRGGGSACGRLSRGGVSGRAP